ncbi:pyridoxamine 5'-phosphate oxidase family protein [Nocardiopsis aegyptia]|uniref:pyridoxamine 5'-phosphate oxidase family protein n=1 Tax=Nocardiopsis aegyptia TaxID=220378 RepID=UPI00366D72B2
MPEPGTVTPVPTSVPAPADVVERLRAERNVWLCTLRRDGSPHVTPVWFAHLRDRWWISVGADSVKVRNAAADPRVSLALEDGDAPVVAEGRTTVHTSDFPPDVVAAFQERYDYDIRVPFDWHGQDRALLEVNVTRWLLSGTAQ